MVLMVIVNPVLRRCNCFVCGDCTRCMHQVVGGVRCTELVVTLGTYSLGTESRLNRIHFHTLAFHILGNVKGAWSSPAGAVAWGALTCSQVCFVISKYASSCFFCVTCMEILAAGPAFSNVLLLYGQIAAVEIVNAKT